MTYRASSELWRGLARLGVLALLGVAAAAGNLLAQAATEKPDMVGNIALNEQTYQKLLETAKAQGRNDLAADLQDPAKRKEAAIKMIAQLRERRGAQGGPDAQQPGGPGGMPGQPAGPDGGQRDPRQWMQRMGGMMATPAVTTTEKYLFIVRGDTVYQLDIDTLEVIKQVRLPQPEGMRGPGGPGGPGGFGRPQQPQGQQQQ